MDFQRIQTNGITLHVACDGPTDGPLVVLLHGFPEFWYGWRAQISALAEAGVRVLAPDLRGYNLSDKPQGVAAYRPDLIADDIVGLIEAAGRARATLVGHDWGGAIAWVTAMRRPDRVSRLVVLNCGHPAAMMHRLRTDRRQLRRSWYILALQLPWFPELLVRADGYRLFARGLRRTARRGTFSDADLDRYREAWAQPGAMTAMMNYYRAIRGRRPPSGQRVTVPTHIVWGVNDRFLLRELAEDSAKYCDDARVTYLDTTHWVQHEAPDEVSTAIIEAARAS